MKNQAYLAVLLGFSALSLSGCANHPIDCAVGFVHADCLPGTAGYADPEKYSAEDDRACQSYALKPGSPEYADCRIKLRGQHKTGVFQ